MRTPRFQLHLGHCGVEYSGKGAEPWRWDYLGISGLEATAFLCFWGLEQPPHPSLDWFWESLACPGANSHHHRGDPTPCQLMAVGSGWG